MIFVPGIIPWFLTSAICSGLKDNIWALILPMLVQPFWVFVLRNFFAALPSEIMESAYIDGASRCHHPISHRAAALDARCWRRSAYLWRSPIGMTGSWA